MAGKHLMQIFLDFDHPKMTTRDVLRQHELHTGVPHILHSCYKKMSNNKRKHSFPSLALAQKSCEIKEKREKRKEKRKVRGRGKKKSYRSFSGRKLSSAHRTLALCVKDSFLPPHFRLRFLFFRPSHRYVFVHQKNLRGIT
jgi:hypothetical protein